MHLCRRRVGSDSGLVEQASAPTLTPLSLTQAGDLSRMMKADRNRREPSEEQWPGAEPSVVLHSQAPQAFLPVNAASTVHVDVLPASLKGYVRTHLSVFPSCLLA